LFIDDFLFGIGKPVEGQAIGGILKGAEKQVLPGIGSAVGGYFGGPTGTKLGGDVASAAGRAFGLELEGLSSEDREFGVARRYVSFAGEAVKNLASAPSGLDPRTAANAAAVAAAKTHAPGFRNRRTQLRRTGAVRRALGSSALSTKATN
jgi:hypothetical protein